MDKFINFTMTETSGATCTAAAIAAGWCRRLAESSNRNYIKGIKLECSFRNSYSGVILSQVYYSEYHYPIPQTQVQMSCDGLKIS